MVGLIVLAMATTVVSMIREPVLKKRQKPDKEEYIPLLST